MAKTDQIKRALAAENAFMMATHGDAGTRFHLHNGQSIPSSVVRQLQGDLFIEPQEDGLFPGCSQTWKAF